MAKPAVLRRILAISAAVSILLLPGLMHADEISLTWGLEYLSTTGSTTDKATGDVTESESSHFTQLYQLDWTKSLFPNLLFRLGGNYTNDDTASKFNTSGLPEVSSHLTERTIQPYLSVDLRDPIYRANLGYRGREAQTDSSTGGTEKLMVDQYDGLFRWQPTDLPLLTLNFERLEMHDDPLTTDSTRDDMNAQSRYTYGDARFQYAFTRRDIYNNLEDSGYLTKTHNGKVDYNRGFDFMDNRFDVNAGARIIQNSAEFTGSGSSAATVDIPAAEQGTPFYILHDTTPASNDPFELTLVEASTPLTTINIGRGGGINPVSAGLGFGIPTEVATIYIQLEDGQSFPNLASSSQIAGLASSLRWHFYSSDDQLELNWTEIAISSATYDSIENRFEIRLASTVSARRIKVTTTPLTLLAPGEIRYRSISALTSLSGQNPENLDQNYSFGLGWTPSEKTTMGYEGYYRARESEPGGSERTSWTNSMYFRHVISQIFSTYGRFYRTDQTLTTSSGQGDAEDSNQSYSLAVNGNYLEKLNQSLIFSGFQNNSPEGDRDSKSVLLRTNADLYTGWSMNIDLSYSLITPVSGAEQTAKSFRLQTSIQPNRRIDLNCDYSAIWVEETDKADIWSQYGAIQVLGVITDNLNMFFRYSFRDQQGTYDISTSHREVNVNWSPFPDGDLRFTIGYSESTDQANQDLMGFSELTNQSRQELKTISPSLTWKIGPGLFFELTYSTGTIETQTETSDFDSYMATFKVIY